jgi:hypothetical protein
MSKQKNLKFEFPVISGQIEWLDFFVTFFQLLLRAESNLALINAKLQLMLRAAIDVINYCYGF